MPVNSEQDCCWLAREVGMQWETGFDLLCAQVKRTYRGFESTLSAILGEKLLFLSASQSWRFGRPYRGPYS
jgi:hypothetical protein